jgi:hypothetical protein
MGLEMGGIRSTAAAKRMRSRLLVQIADFDRYVPPSRSPGPPCTAGARCTAPVRPLRRGRADDWFDKVASDQVAFLVRAFAPGSVPKAATARVREG